MKKEREDIQFYKYFSSKEEYEYLLAQLREVDQLKKNWGLQKLALLMVSYFDIFKELQEFKISRSTMSSVVDAGVSSSEQRRMESAMKEVCWPYLINPVHFKRQKDPKHQLAANMQATLDEASFAGWQKYMMQESLPDVALAHASTPRSPKAL